MFRVNKGELIVYCNVEVKFRTKIVLMAIIRDVSRSGRCPNAFAHNKREDSDLLRSLNLDKKLS